MKIVTVIGARPQFIKAAAVSRQIIQHSELKEIIIHTGQHFDENMSDVFFRQMQIQEPDFNLGINSLGHGAMTGRMLTAIEHVLISEKPDWVLVYGDTNSTLAGALAAAKLNIRTAHIEAGLRSFNKMMPEEINRILTDKISNLLLCPSETAVNNLKSEGIVNTNTVSVLNCGDVMYDAALFYSDLSREPEFSTPEKFLLATIHRAENTDDLNRLDSIIDALNEINRSIDIVIPLHPRTRKILNNRSKKIDFQVKEPVGYLEMIHLLKKCTIVMTDSGGLQKEAYFFEKPCITLREETEWIELIKYGYNVLAGYERKKILRSFDQMTGCKLDFSKRLYGDGDASKQIIKALTKKS